MRKQPRAIPFAGCLSSGRRADKGQHIVFVGLPDDSQSSYRRGCARAPARLRRAYDGECYSHTTESGVDLTGRVADLGDWRSGRSWKATAKTYRQAAAALFGAGRIPFFAGGDHAVTVPVVAGLAALGRPVHVIQIDAHPDLYDDYHDSRSSHACVAGRLLEMDHVASITQLGIRPINATQEKQAERYRDRVHIYLAQDLTGQLPALSHLPDGAPVYVTIDLDGFDPAFAPGVSHPVPGGLSPRQVLNFFQHARWTLVGMDAVEVNPSRDINDQTAILAARVLHEGMGYAIRQL